MKLIRLVPICQEAKTSRKHPEHKIYPYLLKGVALTRPNQGRSHRHQRHPHAPGVSLLMAIMDRHSRKVLSWRLSNSINASFCVEALKEVLARYGAPQICNSDQGWQFTSAEFTAVLRGTKVKISMDGRGRWIDNRMIERLWHSLKHKCVYLNAFETGSRPAEGSVSGAAMATENVHTHLTGC